MGRLKVEALLEAVGGCGKEEGGFDSKRQPRSMLILAAVGWVTCAE
eukprot:CAMPEP_0172727664 /NCGR_PEP_ID=MMETSP1074-20121228/91807_1 /TAXON_ID=2916 /ORGANISM="Ceratium fusus, Strain PA161109" /LENGTH=45 /DNA_ID= /DNA_START= /DNA_END= /DNA_ORIENTATION=